MNKIDVCFNCERTDCNRCKVYKKETTLEYPTLRYVNNLPPTKMETHRQSYKHKIVLPYSVIRDCMIETNQHPFIAVKEK